MSTPVARRPEDRYGADRTPQRPGGIGGKIVAIASVILLVALIFAVARFVADRDDRDVTVEMISHERIDDSTMRLWVDVTRENPDEPSYCIISAINYDMAEVGRRELLIEPGGDPIQRFQVDIPTRELAVSGSVYGCSTIIPSYLKIGPGDRTE